MCDLSILHFFERLASKNVKCFFFFCEAIVVPTASQNEIKSNVNIWGFCGYIL